MPVPPQPKSSSSSPSLPTVGNLTTRMWDAVKKLATITENLRTLEKEDMRIQVQMTELGHHIIALIKDVGELSGQMKSIEKRLDDKDKMVTLLWLCELRKNCKNSTPRVGIRRPR